MWRAALQLAVQLDEFDVADVRTECESESPSKRTVRDVLRTMVDKELLDDGTCPETGRRLYSAGEKLRAWFGTPFENA